MIPRAFRTGHGRLLGLSTHIRAYNHIHIRNRTLVSLSSSPVGGTASESDPGDYCKEHVRKHDYESFLTAQFYPRELQTTYFALRAFYVCVIFVFSVFAILVYSCKCVLFPGRTGDDPGYSIGIYAWEDEDAVLERYSQTNIGCMCVGERTQRVTLTDYATSCRVGPQGIR